MLSLCLLYIISILTQHNQNKDGTVKVSDHSSYAFQCCAIYVHCHAIKKINSKPFNEKSQEHENVVEDQYISNLSRSHVCLIHRFWVICRSVARSFIEFCMESSRWWTTLATNMAAGNQQNIWSWLCDESAYFSLVRQYICVQAHLLIYLKRLDKENHKEIYFFKPNRFVSWCHGRWQFVNSNCCIFKTKDVMELVTSKNIYF